MNLQEVMGRPAKWSWTSKNDRAWIANFVSSDIAYIVTMDHVVNPRDGWHITFAVNKKKSSSMGLKKTMIGKSGKWGQLGAFDIIGSGNALEVLATVNQVVVDFIKKKKPTMIEFTAEEPSRQKLYKRLTIKIVGRLGYKITKMSSDGIFRMVRK